MQDSPLYRGVLAAAIRAEPDLEVVAELAAWHEATTLPIPADLTLLDFGGDDDPLLAAAAICTAVPETRVLILIDADRHDVLARLATDDMDRVGFVTRRASIEHLLSAVRSLAGGNPVIDPELIASLLVQPENPLTGREREVLALVAQGIGVGEIAGKLALSPGTIRNRLSRITTKVGARDRADAVERARRAGWL
ncbi:LuxR C-terminal-related transcriptional regulator [Actinoplanes sp. GCM10030250]|uniref:LuxR C-terminal-related transcriptional regulator n=1 Tax=Actinoplanes sp. GCM10030250 TaxID=3273376 RepID=UPI00360B6263